MKKIVVILLLILPFVLIYSVSFTGRILSQYTHIPVERLVLLDEDANEYEDAECDDDKVDDALNPQTVLNGDLGLQYLACLIHDLGTQDMLPLIDADATGEVSNAGGNDLLDQTIDDRVERRSDNDCNSHVNNITAGNKLLKVSPECAFCLLFLFFCHDKNLSFYKPLLSKPKIGHHTEKFSRSKILLFGK